MGGRRSTKIASLIRREISDMLLKDIGDPRLSFLSITDVQLSDDLQHAKVYVSSIKGEEKKQETLTALKEAQGFFRYELGKRLQLRLVPEILFYWDDSLERGDRIFKILSELEESQEERVQGLEDSRGQGKEKEI